MEFSNQRILIPKITKEQITYFAIGMKLNTSKYFRHTFFIKICFLPLNVGLTFISIHDSAMFVFEAVALQTLSA